MFLRDDFSCLFCPDNLHKTRRFFIVESLGFQNRKQDGFCCSDEQIKQTRPEFQNGLLFSETIISDRWYHR